MQLIIPIYQIIIEKVSGRQAKDFGGASLEKENEKNSKIKEKKYDQIKCVCR